MARPLRIEFFGAVYHVMARGNEGRNIFFSRRDYERFKEYLALAQERFGCFLHTYTLMTNHYHLILETPEGNLSKVMHFINSSYTTYINCKRKRSGHLFQGRYKSIVVDKDSYLLELSRYLHLNPVRAGITEKPEDYAYSSYRSFVDCKEEIFLKTETVLNLISSNSGIARMKYCEFVSDAVGLEGKSPFENIYGGMILGTDKFVKQMLSMLDESVVDNPEVSNRRSINGLDYVEEILTVVCSFYDCCRSEMVSGNQGLVRNVAIYLLKKYSHLGNNEIGKIVGGLSYSGVSKVFQRMSARMEVDKNLAKEIGTLSGRLSNVKG